jgi:hypothetical protein
MVERESDDSPLPALTDHPGDVEEQTLVPHAGTELGSVRRRTHPVISRMSRDVLARAKAQQGLSKARFRLGKYAFREPDYRQILDWAEALGQAPDWVLKQLEASRLKPTEWKDWEPINFVVEDGAMLSLVWDFHRLPLVPEAWQDGLRIHSFWLTGRSHESLRSYVSHDWELFEDPLDLVFSQKKLYPPLKFSPALPFLRILHINVVEDSIAHLDLSRTPLLTTLRCSFKRLAKLDLTPVSELTTLDCSRNGLIELDLTPVPELTTLDCWNNRLTDLDLTPVPKLTTLKCSSNQLTELDLTPVPELTTLDCWENRLTDLDLTPVPKLTTLNCGGNKLTALYLTPVPELATLDCSFNSFSLFSVLDLAPVPKLKELCYNKPLEIINLPKHFMDITVIHEDL